MGFEFLDGSRKSLAPVATMRKRVKNEGVDEAVSSRECFKRTKIRSKPNENLHL